MECEESKGAREGTGTGYTTTSQLQAPQNLGMQCTTHFPRSCACTHHADGQTDYLAGPRVQRAQDIRDGGLKTGDGQQAQFASRRVGASRRERVRSVDDRDAF
jgi:hypothetical protein